MVGRVQEAGRSAIDRSPQLSEKSLLISTL